MSLLRRWARRLLRWLLARRRRRASAGAPLDLLRALHQRRKLLARDLYSDD